MKIYKLLLILITAITISSCTTANNRQETVVVNGEQVTKAELEKIVGEIMSFANPNEEIVRWEKGVDKFCHVYGLNNDEIEFFNSKIGFYTEKTSLKINQCKEENEESVAISTWYFDTDYEIQNVKLSKPLVSQGALNYFEKNGTYSSISTYTPDSRNYSFLGVYFSLLNWSKVKQNSKISRKTLIENEVLLILSPTYRFLELAKYPDTFRKEFVTAFYSDEVKDNFTVSQAIPVVTDVLFNNLKNSQR